ncbi:hypothetical protein niasHT_027939 [Heterodera trifolii]|uniref:B30.2/SPRY domain-containing protein n=1 Tax=Heterodera trifolii TaxID=157864 RepID=A0ABD2JWU6_9BILA
MKEQNELQAKVVEMEDQQKKKKKQGLKEDEQGKNAMPLDDDCVGHHWDSYGYESDGNFRTSGSVWLNESRYEYSRGDIIGCGVNLASRRIIFTHNGRRLDTSDLFLFPSSVELFSSDSPPKRRMENYVDMFGTALAFLHTKAMAHFGQVALLNQTLNLLLVLLWDVALI